MSRSTLESHILRPHEQHPNPHPQYALAAGSTSLTTDSPLPETIGVSAKVGTATTAARSDHVHALPGLATTTSDGFMSAADKTAINAALSQPVADMRYVRLDAGVLWDEDNGTPVVEFGSGLPTQILVE